MRLYRTSKSVLSVSNNAEKFLNGLTSNSMEKPRNAFLTIHGKIISTFDQSKIGDDEFLLIIEGQYYDAVLNHIERYARLSKTIIEKKNYIVYFDIDNAYDGDDCVCIIAQRKGQLIVTEKTLDENVSDEEFTLFRLKNNVPLHGIDYTDEMLLNVSETEHVSFTKGCFLGQEPISKVHNRSKPTWKLVVKTEKECSTDELSKMTSKTHNQETDEVIGFTFVKNE